MSSTESGGKSPDQRKQMLAQHVANHVAGGWRVETQSDFQAIMVKGKPLNTAVHVLITILTAGLWLPFWIILAIVNKTKRQILSVDEFGNVLNQIV